MSGSTVPAPFFEAAAAAERRRLLVISLHFPPGSAVGALRWQKLAALAGERGWSLDVVTLDPAQLTRSDWSRLDELPPGSRAFGVARTPHWSDRLERVAWRAYRAIRPAGPVAGGAPGHAAPDNGAGIRSRDALTWRWFSPGDHLRAFRAWQYFARDRMWGRAAAIVARRLVQAHRYDAVISCGPPHAAHEAGWMSATRGGVPFVMDLRDPWSAASAIQTAMASPVWLRIAARDERRAVRHARLIVANTPALARVMTVAHPEAAERIVTVLNGYDDEPLPEAPPRSRFTIAYAGSIYIDRSPRLLFRACARVVRDLALTPPQFGCSFIGHLDDAGGARLLAMAEDEGLGGFVDVGPPRPREQALAFLAHATMLVSLPQNVPLTIPSKIFEYMRFEAWLLALAARDSSTEQLLRGTSADVVDPQDTERLAAVIRDRYLQFARGERPRPIAADDRFSRRAQARVLFDAIERIGKAR